MSKIIGQGQKWTVIQADVLDYLSGSLWLRQYDDAYFHFLFSDWPYNLDSITRRFGGATSAPAQFGRDGAFARQSRGFMGARWDTDLAYQPETWEAIQPHLYPGAFTASFTHPRKQHRLAMAQEMAGYVMNPALYQLGWCYSSGKPNGSNTSLLLDRRAGMERGKIRIKTTGAMQNFGGAGRRPYLSRAAENGYHEVDDKTPISPLAKVWTSHQYGSPLAPELEPVIIAQAPWRGDRLNTITTTGAGAVNIENGKNGMPGRGHPGHFVIIHHPGCVYRGEKMIADKRETANSLIGKDQNTIYGKRVRTLYKPEGGKNGFISIPHYDCHPDCPAAQLDAQAGEKSYHFYQADWTYEIAERLAEVNPVFYHGKVTEAERNAGCHDLPLKERRRVNPGGLEHEPRFAPTLQYNNHPTLKSIKLCQWIAGLFLPPVEYAPRRCFVPTCGTGSEMIGALLAGWDEVIGVELEIDFAQIACQRLEWWTQWLAWGQTNVDTILSSQSRVIDSRQAVLFG